MGKSSMMERGRVREELRMLSETRYAENLSLTRARLL